MIIFTTIVLRAVTTLYIASTNLKLNFLDALVIHVSLLYIIMSGALGRNLENFQVHLLGELNFDFSIIGVSETKIISGKNLDFNPNIPGYIFEDDPTPLTSGGVGLYINESLKYTVIEKTSNDAFQALWIEIHSSQKCNIICGIVYRKRNIPQRFQEYFDETLEKLIASNQSVYITGDFNINLLHAESSRYAQEFLLSLQSFSFTPIIDKPTRVHNNSATLIDNILTNKVDANITSDNIVSDISDHFSQFCVSHTFFKKLKSKKQKRRDFSGFSVNSFNSELSEALLNQNNFVDQFVVDITFSNFYNTLSGLVEKHVPLKTLSKRKLKHFSKPWITIGLKKSIKVKNSLFQSGNFAQYKPYINKISALTRVSKKNYYHAFFADNLNNMKNTWNGINSLINGKKKKSRAISSLKRLNNGMATDPLEISNIFNNYFSSVGEKLASRVPLSSCSFTDYLSPNNCPNSFFFDAVSPVDIEREILSIPRNKT